MPVVRGGDHHRIDLVADLVEHDSEVVEERLLGPPRFHVLGAVPTVDVAERDEVLLAAPAPVGVTGDPAAGTDERDVELVVR